MLPLTPKEVSLGSFSTAACEATGTVVIIDVFRAFTTAAIALANGASRIIMADSLEMAMDLRRQNVGRYCLGERGGVRPEGFDFGNSPVDILNRRFDGDTLIQTTSNGTRGILAAKSAKRIYAASLVTAAATAEAVRRAADRPVTLVAMGDLDRFRTDEDEICALYLRSLLFGLTPDAAAVAHAIRTMSRHTDGRRMSAADVDCCLDINRIPFAVRVNEQEGAWVAVAEPMS
ncbi:MAG: 2-phosphosulfolactate phosphatase [Sneathiella sp.]|jgi:2-phosphosulfolactate phosphatase|uniref:2-phosphosulfolactate phosphatase n=1 Tax=Sneathiella sp. TaxID=1964365 RepID=UPI000C5E6EEF|nr:2-phosphosulfolactate phosphatase [Sneathiella sp.]MAL78410.1 2-phosphosulfolactate phosphatase [Sneathiella sp.]